MFDASGSPAPSAGAVVQDGAAWNLAPYPALVTDRDGTVVELNGAARALWPRAAAGDRLHDTVPSWLTEAHERLAEDPSATVRPLHGAVADRHFEARPTARDDGRVVWWLVDDTDRRIARAALADARRRSELLSEVAGQLLSTLNLPRCMEMTARMATDHLAEAAVLVAPPQGHRHCLTYAHRGGPVTRVIAQVDVDRVPGLAEALQGFPPVPARWIDPAVLPDWVRPPDLTEPVGSVIVTPLPGHGVPAGALILLRSGHEQAFSSDEELFARLFAARAGAALSAARLYTEQASITTTLMRELLPPTLKSVHGVDYAGAYRPARDNERIGGDFYDVHPGADPDQETLVVLGDVAGKGLEAAVLTGKIRNTLHALLPLAADHLRMLTLLNGALLSSHHTRFATLVLASVRRRGSEVRLRLTSAGHLAPLIVRADGTVEEALTHGSLIGALPKVTAVSAELTLGPGETCVLYTDGVTEARGGPLGDELYGERRLQRAVAECAGMPAQAVVERIQMLTAQWVGPGSHDDIATVAIGAPRSPDPALMRDQARAGVADTRRNG
ncbi:MULTISPECIES: PP2C family protein-serine/threonine phosphatase [unclassified Streptomyces]|uniref:PP2C family protein-serine/threonine phosphatase n=1 Tax=unclassified Streptomyces TaxID=2593676 RepID=UPI003701FC81